MEYLNAIEDFIRNAFREDMPCGDITSEATVSGDKKAGGKVVSRGDYVVSGVEVARLAYSIMDPDIRFQTAFTDGGNISRDAVLFSVDGPARSMLGAERVVLNIISMMTAVATKTRKYCDLVRDTRVVLLDTRKTIPCMRTFQRMAVRHGGGTNHRYSLSDAVLIKENHIVAAGGISEALKKAGAAGNVEIEIEVKTVGELQEALRGNPNTILLDNMSPSMIKKAVEINKGRVRLEASGGIDSSNIREYALTGVDCISLGTLTHTIESADLSFLLEYD